jgi:acylaminoacyl-peptidase
MYRTYAESGLQYNVWTVLPTASSLARMLDVSPIKYADQVKSPVLFLIGAKDLRVPPSQSHEFYCALNARHIETKMLMYEKSSHPLSEVDVEADSFVNTAIWFYNHLFQTSKTE